MTALRHKRPFVLGEVDKKSCSRDQTTRFIARPEWRR
jgi:hypothetical protein